ncbi:unnamed protein product [Linum tenue]|uniref:Cystatin domain-containing protein n=1 Tax=Linum tenue TaxID=586396 RepID=A0AAV0KCS4_9ROSI|nr:unnamed protein product [Linum tenue]
MDSFGDDEFPELTYCDSCRKMAKTEMKEEYDDDDYIYEDDDFGGDDTLKLRMIHYRRNLTLNGCFYADCPPPQYYMYASTQPHSGYHFKYQQGFDDTVQDCAEFAVETFNDELGAEMELREIENVSVGGSGYRQIYMILRCCNVGSSGDGGPDEKTYRVVVSCCWWRKANKKVLVFKDCHENNLLKPNRSFDERTTTEQRSPHPIEHDDA